MEITSSNMLVGFFFVVKNTSNPNKTWLLFELLTLSFKFISSIYKYLFCVYYIREILY